LSERRSHPAAESPGGSALAQRVRAFVGGGGSPKPPRLSRTLEPVGRSALAAAWQARDAVRAGMTLDDFLRSRLARYVAALSVPSASLPLSASIDDGQIVVRPADVARAATPPDGGGQAWIAPLVAAEGPSVREEATTLEARLATIDEEVEAARRRAEEISRRFSADVAAGLVAAPSEVEATAEQLGRPPVRSTTARTALAGVVTAAAAAETWQIAVPLLAGAGIAPGALEAEMARRPGEVVSVLLFALGVAAALFALARGGLAAAGALARGEGDPPRRRWLAATGTGAAALAALVATAVAALPRAASERGAAGGASLALLLLAVPVGAALLIATVRRWDEARAAEQAAALAWDRERARALGERARRLEELEWADEERQGLERQREAARRRLRELNARAIVVGRVAAEQAERERAALARVAQGLVAALELDRYQFVRQATARGALELVTARRRKPPEPRASTFDAGPSPAAVGEVQTGRLAAS
jgi:hypothetical protein